jgi:hypothetical protein
MARPAAGYRLADGRKVPGVTTITGHRVNPGGLMWWAWNEGREGRDYRETRDAAAGIGTTVHELAEALVRGEPLPTITEPLVELGFSAFRRWWEGQQFEVVATEESIVSETLAVGGTLDAVARSAATGKLSLIDYKCANDVYIEALIQVATYKAMWNEAHPEQPIDGAIELIRFSKEFGDFVHRSFAELDLAFEQFKHLRIIYENDKVLKRRAK